MINLQTLRVGSNQIIALGDHPAILQSILDFDYLSGREKGSLVGLVTGRAGFAKYFYGRREILLPTYVSLADLPRLTADHLWFLNLLSSRRTLSSTLELIFSYSRHTNPLNQNLAGGAIFAENVPELHALKIINNSRNSLIIGPASVGLLVPGALKLGAIGGITPSQIEEGKLTEPGNVAALSASGGMTNELISLAVQAGHRLSFALSFGGDRFPVLSPKEAFLLAEADPQTKAVLYYGELGGEDEYELVKLKAEGKFTKTVIAHIAGTVSGLFPESPQFGHAKAKADKEKTTALAKRSALRSAGFQVSHSFTDFIKLINQLK